MLTIGQHVRHHDYPRRHVAGTVRCLEIEDNALWATIGLDEPIVIEARNPDERPINIYSQHVPAHELAPFDERDELIAKLIGIARRVDAMLTRQRWMLCDDAPESVLLRDARAAIASATGIAAAPATEALS